MFIIQWYFDDGWDSDYFLGHSNQQCDLPFYRLFHLDLPTSYSNEVLVSPNRPTKQKWRHCLKEGTRMGCWYVLPQKGVPVRSRESFFAILVSNGLWFLHSSLELEEPILPIKACKHCCQHWSELEN